MRWHYTEADNHRADILAFRYRADIPALYYCADILALSADIPALYPYLVIPAKAGIHRPVPVKTGIADAVGMSERVMSTRSSRRPRCRNSARAGRFGEYPSRRRRRAPEPLSA